MTRKFDDYWGSAPRNSPTAARADGSGLMTLADPEGNEFCVVRNHEERNS